MSAEKISQKELFFGEKVGVHEVTETITGYKKIQCQCPQQYSRWNSFLNLLGRKQESTTTMMCVATLEIPTGSKIVRPYVMNLTDSLGLREPDTTISNKLRTDKAIVTKIEPSDPKINIRDCQCTSFKFSNYSYALNNVHKPDRFDSSTEYECAPGLHFFLKENEAKDYLL